MTIVEVVVAASLLVITVLATFGLVDTSTRTVFRAEETQTVINVAQREMERLRQLSYTQLSMNGVPSATTDANVPTSRMRPVNQFCLARVDGDDPCSPSSLAPLAFNGGQLENGGGVVAGGEVEPFSNDVQIGDITVDIYRFVVWQDEGDELLPQSDPLCQNKPLHYSCKGQYYKRVVVAVRVEQAPISHDRPYEEVQSDFIDPDRATLDAPPLGPGGGETLTGQQFYLSDTRCGIDAGDPTRPPGSDHRTHDTRGICAPLSADAPDALLGAPPIDPDPGREDIPQFFDYSTEIEPPCPDPPPDPAPPAWPENCDPDDEGLQMLEQEGPCEPNPQGDDAAKQIHLWVSRPMPPDFQFVMTDRATLELWTRTIDDVQGASGEVCAFLFKRSATVDTPVAMGSYEDADWPFGAWREARIRFDLDNVEPGLRTLLPGDRLGISIGVDPAGTPDNVLQFLYDHPEGESRVEVLTTTPLP
jgi:type II secretory pathway pseudopilin PulG